MRVNEDTLQEQLKVPENSIYHEIFQKKKMKRIIESLPEWFKTKYKLELDNWKEGEDRFWIELNDGLRLIQERGD